MAHGSTAQKVPLTRALNQTARRQIGDAFQLYGKKLPCSVVSLDGWIVTVKFEITDPTFTLPQITIPVFSSVYDYLPFQVGDKGLCMDADTYLGGISGLGGGTAKLALLPNLTTLGFAPTGNKAFVAPGDPDVRVVQGPNGVIIQTLDGTTTIAEILKDKIKLTRGDSYITIEDSGITIHGDVAITGKLTTSDETDLGGTSGLQFVKLADGSNSTKVKAK